MAKSSAGPAFLEQGAIDAILQARHGDIFAVLGRQGDMVRAFLPGARSVDVQSRKGKSYGKLEQRHSDGFFEGPVKGKFSDYVLAVEYPQSTEIVEDPYRFGSLWGEMDTYLFKEGNHEKIYTKLGAHPVEMDGVKGVYFGLWAPNASRVSVVGSFNAWDGRKHVMRKHTESGVFDIFVPTAKVGDTYKFEIVDAHGSTLPLKADPYAFRAEHPPSNASVVAGLVDHKWRDDKWMKKRAKQFDVTSPNSTYEVHLGSWARVSEDGNRYLSYLELADQLVPYAKEMGFTHLELMPVSEFPFDGSWGYQATGLYAPTIRNGTAEEFAVFVDVCHQNGIGVIVDWVPGHFPTDAHGLAQFDGTALYEHADPRQGFHRDWNTLIYNYGRNEVRNFLVASALYWMDRFHIDGIRVDAVASMLYLDYSRKDGEWIPNQHGGRENLEAINFMMDLNGKVAFHFPGTSVIAEESTAWPGVSKPLEEGGLGFGYKWNMGWMNDTLRYIGRDSLYRQYHQNELTFGLVYAFSENFVLPISHDEVVHGKGSLLGKMPGDDWQKFANLRTYLGFMWTHPGKKLLFMGSEFGQGREWNYEQSLDWHLLDHAQHRGVKNAVSDLNALLTSTPAMYELDGSHLGFQWIDINDRQNSVISFLRKAKDGSFVVVVCNFTPATHHDYRIGVPKKGDYKELFNSDSEKYWGSGVHNKTKVKALAEPLHGQPASVSLTLPPLSTLVLGLA